MVMGLPTEFEMYCDLKKPMLLDFECIASAWNVLLPETVTSVEPWDAGPG